MDRKISICIPTYNRYEYTKQAIEQVLEDNRVDEVVISDDCSTDGSFLKLQEFFISNPKVKVYCNESNLDCYKNKHQSLKLATNDWCILFDSDNILTTEYIDVLYSFLEWSPNTVYQPCFLKPHFDFRKYAGTLLNNSNVAQYITKVETLLNAQNCFVNKNEYLKVWDGSIDPVTSDSLYFNYCWLKAGNNILPVAGLYYDHRVHSGSHYQNNVSRTPKGFHNSILEKIKQLK